MQEISIFIICKLYSRIPTLLIIINLIIRTCDNLICDNLICDHDKHVKELQNNLATSNLYIHCIYKNNNLKITILKWGVGIDHCYKK